MWIISVFAWYPIYLRVFPIGEIDMSFTSVLTSTVDSCVLLELLCYIKAGICFYF